MKLDLAVELCKQFEGLHRLGADGLIRAYVCPAGVPTIGWGTTYYEDGRRVTLDDPPITRERADELLLWELRKVSAAAVARLCPRLLADAMTTGNWDRFQAIVDFTYNLGAGRLQTSTLRRKLAAGDWEGAREQLRLWVRGGGRVLPGLVRRRAAEAALF